MHSFDIDLGQWEIEPIAKNKSHINQRLEEVAKNKYTAGTFTKGFFNQDLEDQFNPNTLEQKNTKVEEVPNQKKKQQRRTSKKGLITLQPLKQNKNTEVFENYNKKQESKQPQPQQLQEIKFQRSSPEPKSPEKSYETRRMAQKRLNSSRKNIQVQKKQSQQVKTVVSKVSTPVFFEQDQQQIQQNPKKQPQSPQRPQQEDRAIYLNQVESQITIAQNRLAGQVFQESDEENPIPSLANSDYFNYNSLNIFKRQLSQQIKKGSLLRLEMVRDKEGFNTFWPEFHLYFCANSHYVMSAKKTSSKPSSTFIISIFKSNFEENSQFYLGKMKSNILGDVLNVFGPGLSPSNAKDKNQTPRQLLATIVYDSHIFQMGKPREFQVFVKKQQYGYYSHFPQVRLYEDEIPLNQLYDYQQNKQKIKVFRNRKPVWLQQIGGYMLNFKGRVETASIKNFILQEKLNGPQTMIFGKVNESKFNLDMSHPISPLIAFAIALSSFDSRIMCE